MQSMHRASFSTFSLAVESLRCSDRRERRLLTEDDLLLRMTEVAFDVVLLKHEPDRAPRGDAHLVDHVGQDAFHLVRIGVDAAMP